MNLPERIEAITLLAATKNRDIHESREQLGLQESVATLEILTAKDEHGKPLYSNETARAAAIKLALSSRADYQEMQSKLIILEEERAAALANVERLRNEFKLYLLDKQLEIAVLQAGQNT